jgi:hypothetical protein
VGLDPWAITGRANHERRRARIDPPTSEVTPVDALVLGDDDPNVDGVKWAPSLIDETVEADNSQRRPLSRTAFSEAKSSRGDSRGPLGVAKDVEGRRASRVHERRGLLGCAIACHGTELAQVHARSALAVARSIDRRGRDSVEIAQANQSLDRLAQAVPFRGEPFLPRSAKSVGVPSR